MSLAINWKFRCREPPSRTHNNIWRERWTLVVGSICTTFICFVLFVSFCFVPSDSIFFFPFFCKYFYTVLFISCSATIATRLPPFLSCRSLKLHFVIYVLNLKNLLIGFEFQFTENATDRLDRRCVFIFYFPFHRSADDSLQSEAQRMHSLVGGENEKKLGYDIVLTPHRYE